ncbi:MAG: MFS transporter [Dehalococcoidia bacterium]|nr:MFS transporter [Dehalococcoidia bacterium]
MDRLAEALHRRLPATRHRDFLALWGGSACSGISLWTLLLGNAWIVYRLTGSSLWVGVSTFASMSPYFLAPFGGTVADRVERRLLVRATRLAALAIAIVLLLLAATGVIAVWMVVGLALLQGVVRAIEIPADNALLANVVPPSDLGNAVSLSTTAQLGSRAVGPVLAGPLLATVGVAGAYGIAVLFTLLSFTSVRRVQTSSRGGVASLRSVIANLRSGVRYLSSTGPVRALFLLVVAHCSLTMSFDAMLPGFADRELHAASSGFTLMMFGIGAGAFVATAVLAVTIGRRRGRVLLITGVLSGLSPALLAFSPGLGAAVVSATIMGSSQAVFMALSAVFLQEVVPDAIRGRVMSFYLMSAGGVMAVANLAFGSLADVLGVPPLLLVPGALFVAVLAISRLAAPNLWAVFRAGIVPATASGR